MSEQRGAPGRGLRAHPVLVAVHAAVAAAANVPGPAGWAWYAGDGCWAGGAVQEVSGQHAELYALLALLRAAPASRDLVVRASSDYAWKACTQWMPRFRANRWKHADGSPLANAGLLREIDRTLQERSGAVTWDRSPGASGDLLVESAQALSERMLERARAGRTGKGGPGWGSAPPAGGTPSGQPGRVFSEDVTARRAREAQREARRAPKPSPRPDLQVPSFGALCPSCGTPVNPYSMECRCSM